MVRAILSFLALSCVLLGAPADQEPQPAAKPHKQVTVPVKTLNRYVGTFTMQGVIMKVTRENSHLFLQKNDDPRVEIFPEAETLFFSKASEIQYSFDGITGGKAIILMIVADGRTTPLYRVE